MAVNNKSQVLTNTVMTGQVTGGIHGSMNAAEAYDAVYDGLEDADKKNLFTGRLFTTLTNIYNYLTGKKGLEEQIKELATGVAEATLKAANTTTPTSIPQNATVVDNRTLQEIIDARLRIPQNMGEGEQTVDTEQLVGIMSLKDIVKELYIKFNDKMDGDAGWLEYVAEPFINTVVSEFRTTNTLLGQIRDLLSQPLAIGQLPQAQPGEKEKEDKGPSLITPPLNLKNLSKELNLDSKETKNLSKQIDGIMGSYMEIVTKYADKKVSGKLNAVRKNFYGIVQSMDSMMHDIENMLEGQTEESLKNIIIFTNVTTMFSKGVGEFIKLLESMQESLTFKNIIITHLQTLAMKDLYKDFIRFGTYVVEDNTDWKVMGDKLKLIYKSFEPYFDFVDDITDRSVIKDFVKAFIFFKTAHYIIAQTKILLESLVDLSYEANDSIKDIADAVNSFDGVFSKLITLSLFSDKVIYGAVMLGDLLGVLNYVFLNNKPEDEVVWSAKRYSIIMPEIVGAIYNTLLLGPGLGLIAKFADTYHKGLEALDSILTDINIVFLNREYTDDVIDNAVRINLTMGEVLQAINRVALLAPAMYVLEKLGPTYKQALENLNDILTFTALIFMDDKFNNDVKKSILNTKHAIKLTGGVFEQLALLGLNLVWFTAISKLYQTGITAVEDTINRLNKLFAGSPIGEKEMKSMEQTCKFIYAMGDMIGALILTSLGMALLLPLTPLLVAGLFTIKGLLLLTEWLFSGSNMKKLRKDIAAFSWTMFLITGSFLTFTLGLLAVSQVAMSPELMLGILAFMGYVVAITGIMWLLSKLGKDVTKAALMLVVVSAALVTVALSLWAVAAIVSTINYDGMFSFMLCTVAIIGVMALLSQFKSSIIMGALMLALTSVVLIVTAASLVAVSALMENVSMGNIAVLAAAVGLLALIYYIVGQPEIAMWVALGAAVMIAMVAPIYMVASSIEKIVNTLKGVSSEEMDNVIWNFGKFLIGVGAAFSLATPVLIGASFGIAAAIGMGPAISGLAGAIQAMANLRMPTAWDKDGNPTAFRQMKDTDFEEAAGNIRTILTTLADPLAEFGGASGGLDWRRRFRQVKKGIKNATKLGKAISSIAGGMQDMAELKMPTEWNADGKPTQWRLINKDDFTAAGEGIRAVLKTLADPLAEFGGASGGTDWRKRFRQVKKGIKNAGNLGSAISSIAGGMQDMAMLKMPIEWNEEGKPIAYRQLDDTDFTTASGNIKTVLDALATPLAEFGGGGNGGKRWRKRFRQIKKGIQNAANIGGAISNIAGGVQDMASLKMPIEWNSEGKPIAFRQLNDTDFENVNSNINTIIGTFTDAIVKWADDHQDYLDKAKYEKTKAGKAIRAASEIGSAISNLAVGIQNMANLNMPLEWNEDGVPVKFQQLGPEDFDNVKRNVSTIIGVFTDAIVAWADKNKDILDRNKYEKTKAYKALRAATEIGTAITNIGMGAQAMAELKMPTYDEEGKIIGYTQLNINKESIKKNVSAILGAVTESCKSFELDDLEKSNKILEEAAVGINTLSKSMQQLAKLAEMEMTEENGADGSSPLERAVKHTNELFSGVKTLDDKSVKNFKEFVNDTNRIKLAPIHAMSKMLDKLNDLIKSQGSLDNFTKTIGETLTPVLVDLVETLTDMKESYDEKQSNGGTTTVAAQPETMGVAQPQGVQPQQQQAAGGDDKLGQLLSKLGNLVNTMQSGLSVNVQNAVAVKNDMSSGPFRVSSGI